MTNYEGCDCGGQHVPGDRAWCLDCHEWCYPTPGMRCELYELREFQASVTPAIKNVLAHNGAQWTVDHLRASTDGLL